MMRRSTIALVTCTMTMSIVSAAIAGGDLWSYEGDTGPANWGHNSPDWAVCADGRYQSPIDIKGAIDANLGSININIRPSALAFGLDGPTFAIPYQTGSMLMMNGTRYQLQQFHFHHLSEHTVNGKHFPMEAHLVLRSEGSDHNDAVIGVFIDVGNENAMLNQFWRQLPRSGQTPVIPVPVNVGDLLPKETKYFMYEGSMTTPGCRQGVRWFVLEQPVEASQAQIDRFGKDFSAGEKNNRPIQKTYGRAVLKSK